MTDTQDLIARLREHDPADGMYAEVHTSMLEQAADALEAAQAEIERLCNEKSGPYFGHYQDALGKITRLEGHIKHIGNDALRTENAELRARLAELEKQEPIEIRYRSHYPSGPADGTRRIGDWKHIDYCAKNYGNNPAAVGGADAVEHLYAAAGASPEPSALQAENAKLITALAACRDAFPVPDAGSRLDDWYCTAMADPLQVPEYVKACVGASPVQPERTLLEQYDLDQSSEYRKGYEDGRLRGFEVGQRYAKEQAVQPSQGLQSVADALTIEQLNDKVERLMAAQPSQAGLSDEEIIELKRGVIPLAYPAENDDLIEFARAIIAAINAKAVQPSQAGELSDTEALNFMELDRGNRVLSIGTGWYSRSSYGKPLKRFGNLRDAIIAAINTKGVS